MITYVLQINAFIGKPPNDERNFSLLNLPVTNRPFLLVKIDAYLDDGQPAQDEAFGIILQVYLLHRRFGTLVQLQFDDIQRLRGAKYHIHTPAGGVRTSTSTYMPSKEKIT